jgi:hypothetical protein
MIRSCSHYCTCCCGSIKVKPETIPESLPKQVRVINELDLLYNRLELLRETSTVIHNSIKEQSEKRKLEKSEKKAKGGLTGGVAPNGINLGFPTDDPIFKNVMTENVDKCNKDKIDI